MLRQLPVTHHPDLLVGFATGDDAAVYRLGDDLALIQTVDFFPPIVDDPEDFGAIAVANSLSDVYAMGGTPLLALNIVCFPVGLPHDILTAILKSGAQKAAEAGVLIVGGHTIDDQEPKYGLAVTGTIKPGKQVTNAGARPGDRLVLTKPIGTGIITTAGKSGQANPQTLRQVVEVMRTLNRDAAAAMMIVGVNACTDITGFGLAGHLHAVTQASSVTARLRLSQVPVISGTWELAERGIAPAGTHRNLESVGPLTQWDEGISDVAKLVLCDAQTSGGLLIAVPAEKTEALLQELQHLGVPGSLVGEVLEQGETALQVVP